MELHYSPEDITLQRHLMSLLKFAPVESRFCSCKRRGKETFDTPINPCARSTCSRSVAVGIIEVGKFVLPWAILLHMLLNVLHQITEAFSLVIACTYHGHRRT